ncbi:MAG: hypothetical protein FJX59_03475, partial [Alphaproteobacteria bacterium]|nr:hypothetical protein [Alphaproteobacteria bacterium]
MHRNILNPRAIIDRRVVGERLTALDDLDLSEESRRPKSLEILREAFKSGQDEIKRRLIED